MPKITKQGATNRFVEAEQVGPHERPGEGRFFQEANEVTLLECPCGTPYSDELEKCPNCGQPRDDAEPAGGAQAPAGGDESKEGATESAGEGAGVDYDGWAYPDLQQEAKARGLNAGGSADDLRLKLMEDDEKKARQ